MWAIVPLKIFDDAKKRLADVLSPTERRLLMLAMARDVLGALSQVKTLSGILIVSRTPEADALAQTFGTERFAESPDANLPQALTQASGYLAAHLGAKGVMIVPADIPLLTVNEIDEILRDHDQVTVIPDAAKVGTNCLICSPVDAIPFIFNGRSFKPHVDAAFARNIVPRIIPGRGFALDIDTREDLISLLTCADVTQTSSYLVKSGIASRLQDPDNSRPVSGTAHGAASVVDIDEGSSA